jgi:hypothetical protein
MTLNPHILAEQDSIYRRAKSISDYLRKYPQPNVQVLLNISRFLRANENWLLRFTTRTGRPLKSDPYQPPTIWGIGKESALSMALDDLCRSWNPEIGDLLMSTNIAKKPEVQDFLARLADVLDPDPLLTEKWKLVYKKPRCGNPRTKLHTEISYIVFGKRALSLYRELETWPLVDDRLRELGLMGEDNTRRKRAVRLVRNSLK